MRAWGWDPPWEGSQGAPCPFAHVRMLRASASCEPGHRSLPDSEFVGTLTLNSRKARNRFLFWYKLFSFRVFCHFSPNELLDNPLILFQKFSRFSENHISFLMTIGFDLSYQPGRKMSGLGELSHYLGYFTPYQSDRFKSWLFHFSFSPLVITL